MASRMMRLSEAEYDKLPKRERGSAVRNGTKAESEANPWVATGGVINGGDVFVKQVSNPHLKYKNRPTGGYSSRKEARRAAELKLLEKAGMVRGLREQVRFELIPSQQDKFGKHLERACVYWADFCYSEPVGHPNIGTPRDAIPEWRDVIEDSKGVRTADYVIKRKLLLFVHGIRIRET